MMIDENINKNKTQKQKKGDQPTSAQSAQPSVRTSRPAFDRLPRDRDPETTGRVHSQGGRARVQFGARWTQARRVPVQQGSRVAFAANHAQHQIEPRAVACHCSRRTRAHCATRQ